MNQLVKIVVAVVVVLGGALYGVNYHQNTRTDYEYKVARQNLRSDYLERAGWVRAVPEPAAYEEEVRGLFKWYFTELTDLYNRFPTFKGAEDRYVHDLDEKKKAGKLKTEEYDGFKQSFTQVKEIWDMVKSGKYQPAMSAGDASMRLDFLEFEPAMIEGQKGIKGRFVLWGAQRRKTTEKAQTGGTTTSRVDVHAKFADVQIKLNKKDAKGGTVPVGEASFGMPTGAYVPYPEAKIEDFPPMAYIGTFAFPLFPFEAETADIEAVVTSRSATGRDVNAHLKWTKDPLPAEWKLKEGEKWEGAQEMEREEEPPVAGKR